MIKKNTAEKTFLRATDFIREVRGVLERMISMEHI